MSSLEQKLPFNRKLTSIIPFFKVLSIQIVLIKIGIVNYGIIIVMARSTGRIDVGAVPPQILWTIVRGDTASFKVYVTDDLKAPLVLEDWSIAMDVRRPTLAKDLGVITDNSSIILSLTPQHDPDDLVGEFTVFLSADQSTLLQTGDIFDIELSTANDALVWTVCQGSIKVLEDVTA